MKCENCGAELQPGNKFCTSCGAPAPGEGQPAAAGGPPGPPSPPGGGGPGASGGPVAVGPPPPPAPGRGGGSGFKSFITSKTGIIVSVIVILLVLAGVALGVFFAIDSAAKKKARDDAVKYAESATGKIEDAGHTLDEIGAALLTTDFTDAASAEATFDEVEDGADSAEKNLDGALSDMEKIDTGKLDAWWKQYVSKLKEGCEEGKKGIADMRKALSGTKDVAEFAAAVNAGVASFEQFIDTMNVALGQHDASQYAEAKATAQTALGYAQEAGEYFKEARKLQPEADLEKFDKNVSVAVSVTSKFQTACDAAAAGELARHDALIDEFNAEKDQINMDMTFDAEAQFGAAIDKLVDSMEKHFNKAADLFDEAEELHEDNTKK